MVWTLLILIFGSVAQAAPNLCDIVQIPNCAGVSKQVRRLSNLSYPSPSTASNTNPALVSLDRGFGVEFIAQPGNPALFNLAGGSGRFGGALISASLENSFFGNRVVEFNKEYFNRHEDKRQYSRKKLNLALGARLLKSRHFSLDAGMIFKRHSEIKDINTGLGVSGRLGPLTFGASVYKDDFILKSEDLQDYSGSYELAALAEVDGDYTESFNVSTFSGGLKIGELSLDAGVIRSKYKLYDDPTLIRIYAASYSVKNLLFNIAYRQETSNSVKYRDGALVDDDKQNATYGGVQYSIGRRLIVGASYNYFLLKEVALTGSVFF